MLTRDLISNSIPYLHADDTVFRALQLMNDNHISHLPVSEDENYVGIVSEEQLLQADEDAAISAVTVSGEPVSVQGNDHFLKAVQTAAANRLSVVPVLQEKQLLGIVTNNDLIQGVARLLNLREPGALIVLDIESRSYSLGELTRIVESNDAQITQLNTYTEPETGNLQVTIRVNKVEVSDIVSSLQRYEYQIKYYFGEELYENELKTNFDNLMNYLQV